MAKERTISVLFDLSTRAKFRITGADRVRYLNGQVSNDVRKATEQTAIRALVLNAKGKINGDIYIHAEADALIIDTDAEMREQIPARLERYIIADDVQIEDATEGFALFHVTGVDVPVVEEAERVVSADRFGCVGADFWLSISKHETAWQVLAATLSVSDPASAEVLRIERGIPRWGRELTEEIIPTEANLEASAIDYTKGCYIGQEVISRIKMSGQTNKRLCGLISVSGSPLAPGMRLSFDGKDVGWITSATRSERLDKQIALGFVKRGHQELGTLLSAAPENTAGSPAVQLEVTALPFVAPSG